MTRSQLRLLIVAAVAALVAVPLVLPFDSSTNHEKVCVAILDGWHADREAPSEASFDAVVEELQQMPTAADLRDPQYRAVEEYLAWRTGPGACVPESRHRLLRSASLLAGLAAAAAVVSFRRRRRRTT